MPPTLNARYIPGYWKKYRIQAMSKHPLRILLQTRLRVRRWRAKQSTETKRTK
jgi:hypothetical protein